MPPKKLDKIDPHNKADLDKRIAELTARLRANANEGAHARRVVRKLQAQRHKLKAWRALRSKQLAALQEGPRKRVLKAALACVGQTENPAGSNKGPGIVSLCQKDIIGYDGVAWCGCFGGYHLKHSGGVAVTSRIAYCPFNVTDAIARANGWAGVRADKTTGQPGDCAMMDWQHDGTADHFVIIHRYLGGGWYETVEGNTSFDNAGSQSNGGCVAIKKRHVNDMQAVCIPAYPN